MPYTLTIINIICTALGSMAFAISSSTGLANIYRYVDEIANSQLTVFLHVVTLNIL